MLHYLAACGVRKCRSELRNVIAVTNHYPYVERLLDCIIITLYINTVNIIDIV
jgi:hypothetical protein